MFKFLRELLGTQRGILLTLREVYRVQHEIKTEIKNMAKSLADLDAAVTELEATVAEVKVAVEKAITPPDVTAVVDRIAAVSADVKTFVPPAPVV
jgi:hypothetical protein